MTNVRNRVIFKHMKFKKSLVVIVVAVLLCAFILLPPFFRGEEVSYSSFISMLDEGKIEKVTFEEDYLSFITTDGGKFSTLNPSSLTLKEELLLNDIEVVDDSASLESRTNTIFNVVFLSLIFFGLYKLLGVYRKTFRVVRHTGVTFSDIAGMSDLKKEMMFVLSVLKGAKNHPNQRPIKGIILEGPPGNGKTLFARALAQEADISFIATKGADFQGALMGLGAMKVKMLFNKAKKRKPCIVFIDEFDSIGEKRNYAGSGIDKENNRIITTLLNEMDGFEGRNNILVIAATNSYASLDPALIRPGRFDLKYTIGNPDNDTRKELIALYTKNKPLDNILTPELLSDLFAGLSSAAIESILNEAMSIMVQKGGSIITIDCIQLAALKCQERLNIKGNRR